VLVHRGREGRLGDGDGDGGHCERTSVVNSGESVSSRIFEAIAKLSGDSCKVSEVPSKICGKTAAQRIERDVVAGIIGKVSDIATTSELTANELHYGITSSII
jgi:hypothetical protein